MAKTYDIQALKEGVLRGDRHSTARAITLIESNHESHKEDGRALVDLLIPHAGNSLRLGISGTPGVGKSTFIEAFGLRLIEEGDRVAVLAIDPSSPLTGGSILGDKTRMTKLSASPQSFIRPSPSGGSLGGVARRTREIALVLEAAGYNKILIETVGVGQSETVVSQMVDIFLMLQLPNAGDELQGIKKGILELADIICVNKCDGDFEVAAKSTAVMLSKTLGIVRHDNMPEILSISALRQVGIKETIDTVNATSTHLKESGKLAQKRRHQANAWFEEELTERLKEKFISSEEARSVIAEKASEVSSGKKAPPKAAAEAIDTLILS